MTFDQQYQILAPFISEERKALFEQVLQKRTRHVTVVLENLFQAHNLSAVLRSCDCFGVQDLHVIENNNDFQLKKRVARGAFKWVSINKYSGQRDNTKFCLEHLRQKGYQIVATLPRPNGATPSNLNLSKPIAIVMGTEWKGISNNALDMADEQLYIPMHGFTESFNVSVATALILSRLTDRIRNEVTHWQLSEDERNELRASWAEQSVKGSEFILQRAKQ